MSASPKAIKQFIAVVELYFPRPKFDGDETQEAAWMAIMARVLSPFDNDVVADGAVRLVSTYQGRFFPKPAECTAACEKAAEAKHYRQTPLISAGSRDPSPYAGWRITLADDLMQSAPGKQAAREGWGFAFHNFCRENGRAPSPHEFAKCKAERRALDEGMAILRKDDGIFGHKALLELGTKMLAKNDELKGKAA